jgi:hypothetical protein
LWRLKIVTTCKKERKKTDFYHTIASRQKGTGEPYVKTNP